MIMILDGWNHDMNDFLSISSYLRMLGSLFSAMLCYAFYMEGLGLWVD